LAGKSAEKAARVASRKRERNKSIRSQVKTNITRAEKLIFTGEMEAARGAVAEAVSSLDKASEKKVIHGNNAARRKSRLVKKLNQAVAQAQEIQEQEGTAEETE
jgi:small subunit ribosomal protein S20